MHIMHLKNKNRIQSCIIITVQQKSYRPLCPAALVLMYILPRRTEDSGKSCAVNRASWNIGAHSGLESGTSGSTVQSIVTTILYVHCLRHSRHSPVGVHILGVFTTCMRLIFSELDARLVITPRNVAVIASQQQWIPMSCRTNDAGAKLQWRTERNNACSDVMVDGKY